MKTTADFLDELRTHYGVTSDNALGVAIGMHRQQLSRYRNKLAAFDDETCLWIADTLNSDPAYVVACMHAQRAKESKIKAVWERIAEKMAAVAAVFAVVMILPVAVKFSTPTDPVFKASQSNTVYYVKSINLPTMPAVIGALIVLTLLIMAAHAIYRVLQK